MLLKNDFRYEAAKVLFEDDPEVIKSCKIAVNVVKTDWEDIISILEKILNYDTMKISLPFYSFKIVKRKTECSSVNFNEKVSVKASICRVG